MAQIYCTQKLLQEIGDCSFSFANKHDTTLMGDWYANIFKVGRYKNLIFVNEKTLFSFVTLQVKKKELQNLHQVFIEGLHNALVVTKQNDAAIKLITDEYKDMHGITKSSNRKITGNMVDLVHHYRCMIQFGDELNEIILKANSIPQRNINWSFSTEALSKLVSVYPSLASLNDTSEDQETYRH